MAARPSCVRALVAQLPCKGFKLLLHPERPQSNGSVSTTIEIETGAFDGDIDSLTAAMSATTIETVPPSLHVPPLPYDVAVVDAYADFIRLLLRHTRDWFAASTPVRLPRRPR